MIDMLTDENITFTGLGALEDLLLWVCSLRDMFEVPCSITGTFLAADPTSHKLLPPIFRKYRSVDRQVATRDKNKIFNIVKYLILRGHGVKAPWLEAPE